MAEGVPPSPHVIPHLNALGSNHSFPGHFRPIEEADIPTPRRGHGTVEKTALPARVGAWFRRRHPFPGLLPVANRTQADEGDEFSFQPSDLVRFWHQLRTWFLVLLLAGILPLTATWELILDRPLGDRRLVAFLLVATAAAILLVDARRRIRRRDTKALVPILLDATATAIALLVLQLEVHALVVPFLYTALTAAILLPVGQALWTWFYVGLLATLVAASPSLGWSLGTPPVGVQMHVGVWIATITFTIMSLAETMVLTGAVRRFALARQSQIESRARRRDEFLAGVSHTLRVPLTGVVGFGQLIERDWGDRLPPEVGEMLTELNQQADAMSAMVDNLVVSADDAAGGLTLTMEPTDLRQAASDVIGSLAWLHPHKIVRLQGSPRVMAWADPARTRQVIRNLLSNAIQHGGDSIVLEALSGPQATLTVTDNGPGPVTCGGSLALEPFQKCSPSAGAPSLGFGLPISTRLAQLMGGSLTHRHVPGVSTFTLSLPPIPIQPGGLHPEAGDEAQHTSPPPPPGLPNSAPALALDGRRN